MIRFEAQLLKASLGKGCEFRKTDRPGISVTEVTRLTRLSPNLLYIDLLTERRLSGQLVIASRSSIYLLPTPSLGALGRIYEDMQNIFRNWS